MPEPQVGRLAQPRWQCLETTFSCKSPHGLRLPMCGARGAHEVRVVGIGEAIRPPAGRADNGSFLEDEDGIVRTGRCKHIGDRLRTFRVGDRVPATIERSQLQVLASCEVGKEARALQAGGTDLEVRSARAAQRTAAEQCAAEVRTPAARSADHTARRTLERRVMRIEDARIVQNA
jgi:hypothetical protein